MALMNYVQDMHQDWYGNGREGWKTRIVKFIDNFEGAEKERMKAEATRHHSNTTRLNIILALTGIAAVALTAIGIVVGVAMAKHASLDPFIIGPPAVSEQYADNEQKIAVY